MEKDDKYAGTKTIRQAPGQNRQSIRHSVVPARAVLCLQFTIVSTVTDTSAQPLESSIDWNAYETAEAIHSILPCHSILPYPAGRIR